MPVVPFLCSWRHRQQGHSLLLRFLLIRAWAYNVVRSCTLYSQEVQSTLLMERTWHQTIEGLAFSLSGMSFRLSSCVSCSGSATTSVASTKRSLPLWEREEWRQKNPVTQIFSADKDTEWSKAKQVENTAVLWKWRQEAAWRLHCTVRQEAWRICITAKNWIYWYKFAVWILSSYAQICTWALWILVWWPHFLTPQFHITLKPMT